VKRNSTAGTLIFLLGGMLSLHAQAKPDSAAGAQTFSRNCAGCHGADGRGGERAPNIATNRLVSDKSTADLEAVVRNGVAGKGMPPFAYLEAKGVSDVVAYLRVLQGKDIVLKTTGDAAAGKDLFFGKAQCAQCHMVKGSGGFLGPDLSAYASGITTDDIRLDITQPDRKLQPTYAVADLTLANGKQVSGTVRAEDNFTIVVQTDDGAFRSFNKTVLKKISHTTHSTMPGDYATRLSAKDFDDLISYLVVTASDAPAKPARRRRQ
jgi:cytochrome c oxidase cbb3-type subunit 3